MRSRSECLVAPGRPRNSSGNMQRGGRRSSDTDASGGAFSGVGESGLPRALDDLLFMTKEVSHGQIP